MGGDRGEEKEEERGGGKKTGKSGTRKRKRKICWEMRNEMSMRERRCEEDSCNKENEDKEKEKTIICSKQGNRRSKWDRKKRLFFYSPFFM